MRRKYSAASKAKVALEAIGGELTLFELASRYDLDPNQISKWKSRVLEGLPELRTQGMSKERSSSNPSSTGRPVS